MTLLSEVFGTAPVADTAVAIAWKSTAILVAVTFLMLATWRRPTISSAIAGVGHVALIILPLLILVMPPLLVRCLPPERTVVVKTEPLPPSPEPRPELPSRHPEDGPLALGPEQREPGRQATMSVSQPDSPRTLAAPVRGGGVEIRPTAVLLVAYLAVVAVMLARLAFGLVAVSRLRRQAVAADEREWLAALEHWRTRLGIRRRVGLAWSSGVSVPVAVGWLRPMVLLPASAGELEVPGHADAILVHELAHIRRGDFAWNVIQRLAVSLYWLHPLAWLLAKGTAAAREWACDDLCVHELGGPAGYRATLLAVASGLVRRPGPALGLAMARSPRLARRLRGIELSRGASRCLPPGRARAVIAATALVFVGLVGAARLTRAEAKASPDELPKAATAPDASGKLYRLHVVSAATGKPIPKANVRIWIALRSEWKTTDDQGTLAIRHSTGPADQSLVVDVWGDGFAMQRHDWGDMARDPIPEEATVKLMPGESLGGLVKDEQGRPISGASVYLWSHNYKRRDPAELIYDLRAISGPDGRWRTTGAPETTGELLGFYINHPDYVSDRDYRADREIPKIADLRAARAVSIMKKGAAIQGRVLDAEGRPVAGATVISNPDQGGLPDGTHQFEVTTDAAGRFRTGQVRPGVWFLISKAQGYAPGEASVQVGKTPADIEIRLGRPRTFACRVVDAEGRPIHGAFVNVESWRGYRFLGTFLYTDRDGRIRWDGAPADPLKINVIKEGFSKVFDQHVEATEQEVLFRLKASLHIRGRVRAIDTKKSIPRATIEYGAVAPKTGDVPTWQSMPATGFGVNVHQGYLDSEIPIVADAFRVRIVADGYEPFVSRVFRRGDRPDRNFNVDMIPIRVGKAPAAKVIRPDGKPLVGARAYRRWERTSFRILEGQVECDGYEQLTGSDGAFTIPSEPSGWLTLILTEDCYAIFKPSMLPESSTVRALPYGRIEGRFLIGSRPGARVKIALTATVGDDRPSLTSFYASWVTTTDDEGRFHFDKVIPAVDLRVARQTDGKGPGVMETVGVPVHLEPGGTASVSIGGTGLPVIGRVEAPEGWPRPLDFASHSYATLERRLADIPFPPPPYRGEVARNPQDLIRQLNVLHAGDERPGSESVSLGDDGSFRIEDVPPGEYLLRLQVNEPKEQDMHGPFGILTRLVTVPRPAGGRTDRSLNLGTLRMPRREPLRPGDPAPRLAIKTADGQTRNVPGDYRGKVLLVEISSPFNRLCIPQMVHVDDVYAQFGDVNEFALLSVNLAEDNEAVRKYLAQKNQPWPQALVGRETSPITSALGLDPNSETGIILIGPDGNVLSVNPPLGQMGAIIKEALSLK